MSLPLEELRRRADGDDATRAVYADALLQAGDPRGELIHLQAAIEGLEPEDPRRLPLEAREALLFDEHGHAWEEVGLAKNRAAVRLRFRSGFIDQVVLERVRWRSITAIRKALARHAGSATSLAVHDQIDWACLARLFHALPHASALELAARHGQTLDDPRAFFDAPAAEKLARLAMTLEVSETEAFAAAIAGSTRIGALRELSLDTWRPRAIEALANLVVPPRIASFQLRAYGPAELGTAQLVAALTGNGRRDAADPVRDVDVSIEDPEALAALARDVPARYRTVRFRGPANAHQIAAFLASDAARELASFTVVPIEGAPAPPVEAPLRSLALHGATEPQLAQLAQTLRAPSLRQLQLTQRVTVPDEGLARILDAPWFDTVQKLQLRHVQATPTTLDRVRAAPALEHLAIYAGGPAVAALAEWRGLRGLRTLTLDQWCDADAWLRVLASPALQSVEVIRASVEPEALHAMARARVPGSLSALYLRTRNTTDDGVAALSRWPGARQLRVLRLDPDDFEPPLTMASIDRFVDRELYPALEVAQLSLWDSKLAKQAAPRLRARFGGIPRSPRHDGFFA
ncbi:MAG: hypothetical protein ACTHU0_05325 [Kofleriaceae bacterium]